MFWKYSKIINRNENFELTYYKWPLIWNVTVWYSLFLNQHFQKTKFTILKFIYFHFSNTKQENFWTRLGKILIHKKFSETWVSNFKGAVLGLRWFLAIKFALKMMKNAFYFTLKAPFVLEIFKFLCWSFNWKTAWLRLISWFMTSRPG